MMAVKQNAIPPFESYDPLRAFLVRTLHLTPLRGGVLLFFANILVDAWIGLYYHVLWSKSETPGLLQDYGALVIDFVANPVIFGLYLWTLHGATKLFQQLRDSGVFKSDTKFMELLDEHRPLFSNRKVFYGVLVCALLLALNDVGARLGWLPWKMPGGYMDLAPHSSYARAFFWFLHYYGTLYGIFNVAVTIFILRKLFRAKEIKVMPLHPDRFGAIGLAMSGILIFQLQNSTLFEAFPILLAIVAYVLLCPLFFFWPLGTAHEAMQAAKDAELLTLARHFDSIYEKVKTRTPRLDDKYEDYVKQIEQVKKLYQITEDFPVWPFDVGSLRRFFTIVTAPILLPGLASIIAEVLSRLFIR